MKIIDADKLKRDLVNLFDSDPEIFNFKARVKLLCLIEDQPEQKTIKHTPLNMAFDLEKINVDRELEVLNREKEHKDQEIQALRKHLSETIAKSMGLPTTILNN